MPDLKKLRDLPGNRKDKKGNESGLFCLFCSVLSFLFPHFSVSQSLLAIIDVKESLTKRSKQ